MSVYSDACNYVSDYVFRTHDLKQFTGQIGFVWMVIVVLLSFNVMASVEPIADSAHVLAIIDDAFDHLDALKGEKFIDTNGKDIALNTYDIEFKDVTFFCGEGVGSLSGGEKQRISIARAMLKDAPAIILLSVSFLIVSFVCDNKIYAVCALGNLAVYLIAFAIDKELSIGNIVIHYQDLYYDVILIIGYMILAKCIRKE